jgi:rubrerythrin
MTARETGDMPHVAMTVIDENTVRYGGSFFRRERRCTFERIKFTDGTDGPYRCSECGSMFSTNMNFRHCPHCGARIYGVDA